MWCHQQAFGFREDGPPTNRMLPHLSGPYRKPIMSDETTDLQARYDALSAQHEELIRERDSLQGDLTATAAARDQFKTSFDRQSKQNAALATENARLREELKAAEAKIPAPAPAP